VTRARTLLAGLSLLALFGAGLWLAAAADQPKPDVHDPANAVANLDVAPGLQATLFASEPTITNPTNLDIDHRGRVWLCDVMNYRGNNGKRPEGDRILILEDTDGDGKADTCKVFYQGRDVDSAMGICVLGNKVIVSCSPNVLVFTFDENDRVLKKEVLFTKTGQPQHDHSAHTFLFGPDGKLYWNFGNTGQAVHDKNGKPVIDLAGNRVVDNGKPYFGGMVFRCDTDGSNFEVLAHNFRNNYEVTVDSFGTLWQSDNDDDGNRGTRINYVMEFGNFGYRDEMTGAGWQAKRTNWEAEVPLRHWHLNDPGVVPNLLQTGAGSPCGICFNEGSLLPAVFHNQIIHCEPGNSVVRAYPVKKDGAGYRAEIVNILDGQRKNNWFRPADVCVAPDGSLFVTDWYDPGVGGHGQRDLSRGRVFRVAPPGKPYKVPYYDISTPVGAAATLQSPNLATRYMAWTALHNWQEQAEPALLTLWKSGNPRERARALWLLGKIDGKGREYVEMALKEADTDIRIVGIRLARQLGLDMAELLKPVVSDPSPQVLREAAIALRFSKSPDAPAVWASLASRHDGHDRWYLEALGIGAALRWDEYLGAWLARVGDRWDTPIGLDIVWRSRAARTPELLAKVIADPSTPDSELPRYFRAFDFQSGPALDGALTRLAFETAGDGPRADLVRIESVARLKGADLKGHPERVAALERMLERGRGTPLFVELVEKFGVADRYPDLLGIAQKNPEEQIGVNAVRVLLDKGQTALLRRGLADPGPQTAVDTARALGSAGDARAVALLLPILKDARQPAELRRQAVRAVARTHSGAVEVVRLARAKELPDDLKVAAGAALQAATWKDVKQQAAELFPAPAGKDNVPLPPIGELAKRRGDAAKGQAVFATTGTCVNCHVVNGAGKEVGPDLSEIGKKLGREAVLESILYPSASISHNYETYNLETKAGTVASGLLVSQTAEEIVLKGADGLVRTFKRAEVESFDRSNVSLMPADIQKVLSAQDLADLTEYLLTLREAKVKK
jgi:putative membrane-bound dehydrogenase-like protein